MDFSRVTLDFEDELAVITLNHPETMNAMGVEMLEGFTQALDEIEHNEKNNIRCLLLTGQGRGFCSGANLAGDDRNQKTNHQNIDMGSRLETGYHPALRRLRNLEVPFITAVNGAAAGVGMSFALMGDLVVASQSAFFLQAFRRIGLVPDGGSTWILPRLVGVARAREMALLGERISAQTALDWGMINRVFPDDQMMAQAKKLAKALSQGPTKALTLSRHLFWASLGNDFETQIDLERQSQKIAGRTKDRHEGVMAFLEKRDAKFQGE